MLLEEPKARLFYIIRSSSQRRPKLGHRLQVSCARPDPIA